MMALLTVWLATAAQAKPPELVHPGEMYGHWGGWTGTAYTTPKGSVMLHPLLRSSFGLADFVDLKLSFLGEILRPHAAIEIAPVQTERFAFSVEARAGTGWGFRNVDYGVVPHLSVYASPKVLIDASVGVHGIAGGAIDEGDTTGTSDPFRRDPGLTAVRPELSVDFHLNDPLWLVLTARGDTLAWSRTGGQGALGAYVVYGKGTLGLSGGANLAIVGLGGPNEFLARMEQDLGVNLFRLPAAFPIPLPHLQLWMRL